MVDNILFVAKSSIIVRAGKKTLHVLAKGRAQKKMESNYDICQRGKEGGGVSPLPAIRFLKKHF